MFDPSINISLYEDVRIDTEDFEWTVNEFDYPLQQFVFSPAEPEPEPEPEKKETKRNQIRNHDCMWSGRCTSHPNECGNAARSACNTKTQIDTESKKQTVYAAMPPPPAQVLAEKAPLTQTNGAVVQRKQTQNIPPGRSLLRQNQIQSKQQHQQHQQQLQQLQQQQQEDAIELPIVTTNEFLRDRDFNVRPDTPLSLDDELMNVVELAACTMGSNRQRLTTSTHTEIINILKEHLEDENSSQTQIRNKLSNYLPILCKSETIDELYKDIQTFSDYEFDDEDGEVKMSESDFDSGIMSSITLSPSSSMTSSSSIASPTSSTTMYENTQSMHTDHSYTRSKSRVDVIGLGVVTPSDSGKCSTLFRY